MTEPARRKRPHPAAATRILVAGAATAGTLAMVGAMAGPLDDAPDPAEAVPASLTSAPGAATVAPRPSGDAAVRIVVVRRHHPVPGAAPAVRSTGTAVTASVSRAPAVGAAPAQRPAPVTTKSRGS